MDQKFPQKLPYSVISRICLINNNCNILYMFQPVKLQD